MPEPSSPLNWAIVTALLILIGVIAMWLVVKCTPVPEYDVGQQRITVVSAK